ncbi:MAG: DUF1573 domain-containing protein [Bacteroidetes bacterium]|nr:DUF1573 domain-containing protein [Bacteroidota bacterium]
MKTLFTFSLFFLFVFNALHSQTLELYRHDVLLDTVPFKFERSSKTYDYSKFREIRIGCLNTGKKDLVFTTAQQAVIHDTAWLPATPNVHYPNSLKPGQYGEISIIYTGNTISVERIKIISNSRTGAEIIALHCTYKDPVTINYDNKLYNFKVKEGDLAHFNCVIMNNGTKTITVDSVSFAEPTLSVAMKLPVKVDPGKAVEVKLNGNSKGKMNFYYGGNPAFFFHADKGREDFVTQEFSCVIIPNLVFQGPDTFFVRHEKRGTTVTGEFKFVNKGSVTLDASKSGNPCIVFDKTSIAPGENFSVKVSYNTLLADSGHFTKEFPILFSPFFYSFSVYMAGEVDGKWEGKNSLVSGVDATIDYGTISNDSVKVVKRVITMKNNSGVAITVTGATTSDGAHAGCSKKDAIQPGENFQVIFIYDATHVGIFERAISITYTSADCTNGLFTKVIRVKGEVKGK